MKFEFAAQSAQDSDNRWAASSRLLNMYREPIDGRTVVKSVPGTLLFGNLPGVFCRAMAEVDGILYAVHGEYLYKVEANGVAVQIGTIPDDPNTTISGNNGKVTICAGGNYYLWDGTTLSEPAAGAFSEFGSVTFYKQLTVLTELGGRRVQWSNPAAPATLDGLSFATAETSDADIVRAIPLGGALWVFKEASTEVWASYTDTSGAIALQAIAGSTSDRGLKAFGLMAAIPNGVFFVGNDNVAYLGSQEGMQRVSNAAVETSIAQEEPTGAAYYEDEGHKFCALLFDSRPAWVVDIATGEWHERAEGNTLGPWSVQVIARAYGKFIAGTKRGPLVRFARVGADLGKPLVRRVSGRTLDGGMDRFRIHEVSLPMTVGTVYNAPTGEITFEDVVVTMLDGTPITMLDDDDTKVTIIENVEMPRLPSEEEIELRVSGDNGFTWSKPIARGLGLIGEYNRRVVWNRLGQYEQFTAEITYAGPADISIDASLNIRTS
ncbi:hypothetical protein [Loktanella sp. R86503]|uniref:hypothetical protein n=1 Tax=Loktanella sp. R86503 TaxID=3093847 RepID=UPI0036DA167B